ncbi:MAG: hypothetical protein PHW04_02430 [Candidatus Wallbacteria bacterium]|nr:hypothetical protein [Candidatus Wallbacteria bacterium]
MTKRFAYAFLIAFLFLSACGGGGSDGGGGTVTPLTSINGSVYQVAEEFVASLPAPAGYSPVSGTAAFTPLNGNFTRTVMISGSSFSLPLYEDDFTFSGTGGVITGNLRISFGGKTADGRISANRNFPSNDYELRITTTSLASNQLVVLPKQGSTTAGSFNLKLYYFNAIGNLIEFNSADLFFQENGKSATYTPGGVTIPFTESEYAMFSSGMANLMIKTTDVFARKTLDVTSDHALVIIESGNEDLARERLNGSNAISIYSAYRMLIAGQFAGCLATLSGLNTDPAESRESQIAASLAYFGEKNWAAAYSSIASSKSSSQLAAVIYASLASICETTPAGFTGAASNLESLLPPGLYLSDGYSLGISNTDAHTVCAICDYYAGDKTSAASQLAELQTLLSRIGQDSFRHSAAGPVSETVNQI